MCVYKHNTSYSVHIQYAYTYVYTHIYVFALNAHATCSICVTTFMLDDARGTID